MTKITGTLLALTLGLTLMAAPPASAQPTLAAAVPTTVMAAQVAAGAGTASPAARYWSCLRIENEFVGIIGAWGTNPQLGPQVNTAMRTLITHVKNKGTKRLMRQVRLVQDPSTPEASVLFNTILARIANGQC